MDLQLDNMPLKIEEIRGRTLKLVKVQAENAPLPMLSMPSWRRREFEERV